MVEQVFGGGGGGLDVPGGCAAFLGKFFSSYCTFCVGLFQFTDDFFWVDMHIFCCILCVFHQKVKQCFGHKIFVMYNRSLTF